MTVKRFPGLSEEYCEQRLSNGLTVRVFHKPEFDKVYAFLAIRCGSVDFRFRQNGTLVQTPAGIAHYLEHKMFDLPDGNAMQLFTELGGNPNAFTAYGMTAYFVQTTQNAEENLRLLLRMVLTPCFTEESVAKEQGIIAQEIKMYEDSADSRLYELLYENLFPEHTLRVPIAGSVESIETITAQTLRQFYDAFYQPSNMILCVEGNLSPERVLAIAEEQTEPEYRPFADSDCTLPPETAPQRDVRREMDVALPMFTIGFPCPDVPRGDVKTEIASELAAELLAGEGSELYQRLYAQGLIDTGFSVGFESTRGKALIAASGDSVDPAQVCEALLQEAERMRREGISTEELSRLKKSAIGRRLRGLDSFAGTCYREASCFLDGYEYLEFPDVYASVTERDVLRQLSYIVPETAVRVTILPREQQEVEV